MVQGFHYFDIPIRAMTMMHYGYQLLDCLTEKLQEGGKDDGKRAALYAGRQPKNHVIVSYSSLLSLFDEHTHLVTIVTVVRNPIVIIRVAVQKLN